MKICRFTTLDESDTAGVGWGCIEGDQVIEMPFATASSPGGWLAHEEPMHWIGSLLTNAALRRHARTAVRLMAPVDTQEVWAAGVTYERSRQARVEESEWGASAYDRVYGARRPELFFKSPPGKVSGPGGPIGVRADSGWTVPEPELALVLDARGRMVGCTVGNDVSARDIEGENLLYLPQAKIYRHSCALGPWIVLGAEEPEIRTWDIALEIRRLGSVVFAGSTSLDRIRRSFDTLAESLFASQDFPTGVVLLTGTGVVPPDDFTLEAGDEVTVRVSGIGELTNPVVMV